MNTIAPYLQPIGDIWAYFTEDRRFKDMTEYPGDWHIKFVKNQRLRVNDEYTSAYKRFYEEPQLEDTLWDNAPRLTILAFAERWIAVRQAQKFLKTRFGMSNNNVGALNAIRTQGILGAFRGNAWNIFHFIGVHYHALLYADKDPLKYLIFSSIFEAALYPIDTMRTLYYADVNKTFRNPFDAVTKTVAKGGLTQFYAGLDLKIFYNVLFGINLWALHNDSDLKYLTLPLWLSSYGLLSLKTRLQVAGSSLSYQTVEDADLLLKNIVRREGIKGLYNGFLPFAALNIAFAYCFPSILSEDKKRRVLEDIVAKAPQRQDKAKYWA